MEKKRVIIFAMSMGSGGAERVISLLLPMLIKDYEVTLFLVINNLHYPIPEEVKVVIVSQEDALGTVGRIKILPKVVAAYRSLLKKEKPAISLSFLTQPNLISGYLKNEFPDTKFVLSERAYPSIEYKSSFLRYNLYKILIKKYYNAADLVFSNSLEINKDLLVNFGIKNKMKVLYNPVQTFQNNLYHTKEDYFKVISVGRLISVKNHLLIIKAVELIKEKNEIYVELVGEGYLRPALEKSREAINLSLFGNSNNVNERLKKADCFILSSNSEGFPNALLEAMAVGLPVISTNCKSGPLELLNYGTNIQIPDGGYAEAAFGILTNVNDELGLAKAISFLKNNLHTRERYSELSFQRSHDFSLTTIYTGLTSNIFQ